MQPFYATANSAEAVALYTEGVKLYDPPGSHHYTVDWLEKNGFASVKEAVKSGRHGKRAWFFHESEQRQIISATFLEAQADLRPLGSAVPTVVLPKLGPKDCATLCAFIHANRQFIENIWKSLPHGKVYPGDNGGEKVVYENTPRHILEKMGL